jgi:hypothetical protein
VCWTADPELLPARDDASPGALRGPDQHVVACHDRPTPEEVVTGRPVRPDFAPAPAPAGVVDALRAAADPSAEETLVVFEGPTLDPIPAAADLDRASELASPADAAPEDPDSPGPADR